MKQLQKKNSNIYRKFSTDRGRSALKFWSSLFKEWLLEEFLSLKSKVVFIFCRNIYGNYFSPCIFGSFSSSFLSIQTASHLVSLKKVKYNLRPYLGPWGIYFFFVMYMHLRVTMTTKIKIKFTNSYKRCVYGSYTGTIK